VQKITLPTGTAELILTDLEIGLELPKAQQEAAEGANRPLHRSHERLRRALASRGAHRGQPALPPLIEITGLDRCLCVDLAPPRFACCRAIGLGHEDAAREWVGKVLQHLGQARSARRGRLVFAGGGTAFHRGVPVRGDRSYASGELLLACGGTGHTRAVTRAFPLRAAARSLGQAA
jgi:hypothetical protein